MKRIQRILIPTAALIAISMAGCVDTEEMGTPGSDNDVRKQAVTVVPEFVITGSEQMPDSLFVTELGLVVSEIRLEPTWSGSLAYTTRDPMLIDFDVANGQTTEIDQAVELPDEGRYLVSIRLEPVGDDDNASSFSMNGFVLDDDDTDEKIVDDTMDGEPQPMPFNPDDSKNDILSDRQADPEEWRPFDYHSKRAVFYTFSDVVFEPGEQYLTFSFDVRDWAVEVVEPISNAVRTNQTDSDSVDVTKQVDGAGTGVEALIETGVVQSARR